MSSDILVAARRVGARMLERLERQLSDRDRDVLDRLAEHRFLTTLQVEQFCFLDHRSPATAARTSRRVLTRLERDGLVRRLKRRIGGVRAGSAATVWQLASAGARLRSGTGGRYTCHEPSERFLSHRLAVADVHLLLLRHRELEPVERVTVAVEPACWRRYQGTHGEARWLQPDLYAELTTSQFVDCFFVEVDLGTESLPTLLGKCAQYEAYRASGQEQAGGVSFPLVIWLLGDHQRAGRLARAVGRDRRLTSAMFRFATPETLPSLLAGEPS